MHLVGLVVGGIGRVIERGNRHVHHHIEMAVDVRQHQGVVIQAGLEIVGGRSERTRVRWDRRCPHHIESGVPCGLGVGDGTGEHLGPGLVVPVDVG